MLPNTIHPLAWKISLGVVLIGWLVLSAGRWLIGAPGMGRRADHPPAAPPA